MSQTHVVSDVPIMRHGWKTPGQDREPFPLKIASGVSSVGVMGACVGVVLGRAWIRSQLRWLGGVLFESNEPLTKAGAWLPKPLLDSVYFIVLPPFWALPPLPVVSRVVSSSLLQCA